MSGPFGETSIGSSPSRDRIFVCSPKSAGEERACAEQIARTLAGKAYRRPVNDTDMAKLMSFYESGRKEIGDFDGGVQELVMGMLSSPDFLYRIIPPRGDGHSPQPLTALELASRLSFFLWSSIPDEALLQRATSARLREPAVLSAEVKRMLADPRAQAFVSSFAGQWLQLRNLQRAQPDPQEFPDFDDNLRQAFRTETEMLFASIMAENRSVLELLTAEKRETATHAVEAISREVALPVDEILNATAGLLERYIGIEADMGDQLRRILTHSAPFTRKDVVVIFVTGVGERNGRLEEESVVLRYDGNDQLGAIQLTTAAGCVAMVELFLAGKLPAKGFVRQEDAVLADFLATKAGARLVGEARGVDAAGLVPSVAIKSAA